MPGRYFSQRDRDLFETVSTELVGDLNVGKDGIINQTAEIFKILPYDTDVNIYGEAAKGKVYSPGVQVPCLISHEDFDFETTVFGPDKGQNAVFAILRQTLIDANIRPEIGDLVAWNFGHFEISSINENQLIGGQDENNWTLSLTAFLVRSSNLNIQRVRSI